MAPTIERLREAKPEIERIGREFGVSNIRVFGSVVRGTAGESSDVDLLVRVDSGRSLLDVIGFEQDMEKLLETAVDVVEEGGVHPLLEETILLEALPP